MAFGFNKFWEGIKIKAKAILTGDSLGDIEVSSATNKANFHNGTTSSPIVTEAHVHTLTNKTIDVDNNTVSNIEVDNLKAGVLDTDLTAVALTDTTIPSAKATKAYADSLAASGSADLTAHIDDAVDAHDASAISVTPAGDLASTDVQSALIELQGDIDADEAALAAHLGDAVDSHDASSISVVPSGDLTATDVQAALVELQSDIDTDEAALTAHTAASSGVHGVTGSVVGTTDTQTVTNKTIGDALDFVEIATPAAPAANTIHVYAKDFNGITRLVAEDSTGFEVTLGGEVYYIVRNSSGSTINKGQAVYVSGATGQNPNISLARADSESTLPSLGIVGETIANNSFGRVITKGIIDGFDTSAFAEGDSLYVSSTVAGAFQNTRPAHPNFSQRIGLVLNSHVTQGKIEVDNLGVDGNELGTISNTFSIGNNAAGTKTVEFKNGNSLSLSATPTGSRTLTLPDVTDTLVGRNTTDTLTNKTLTSPLLNSPSVVTPSRLDAKQDTYANLLTYAATASNGQLVFATDTKEMYQVVDGALSAVGGGGGQGGINFITLTTAWSPDNTNNSTCEESFGDWATFKDAAAATPEDLTGGVASNLTFGGTAIAGEILNGIASFKLTKAAANAQGEGVSCTFNAPPAYQGKLCKFSYPYKLLSGSLTTGDVISAIYDVTNARLIPILGGAVDQTSGTCTGYFTTTVSAGTPANQQYRLGLYFASTATTAATIVFDDVVVEPVESVQVPNITNWAPYPTAPTLVGFGTPTNVDFYYRQVGDEYQIRGAFTSGSPTATQVQIPLPFGAAIKAGIGTNRLVGQGARGAASTTISDYSVLATAGNTYVNLGMFNNSGASSLAPQGGTTIVSSGDVINVQFEVPVESLKSSAAAVIVNPNIGPWESWNLVAADFTGFGTPTNITGRRRQVGQNIEGEVTFTAGTTTAIEARLSLGAYTTTSDYPTLQYVGTGGGSEANQMTPLAEASKSYITFGKYVGGTTASLVKANGSAFGTGSTHSIKFSVRVTGLSAAGVINNNKFAYLRDEKTSGTAGGGATSGSYATRTLNTISDPDGIGITLAANQFTLPAGKYRITARAPAQSVNQHKAKLRNVTDSSDAIIGSNSYASNGTNTMHDSVITGLITITSSKTFEIQHRVTTTRASDGFGVANSYGDTEVYTTMLIEQVNN